MTVIRDSDDDRRVFPYTKYSDCFKNAVAGLQKSLTTKDIIRFGNIMFLSWVVWVRFRLCRSDFVWAL